MKYYSASISSTNTSAMSPNTTCQYVLYPIRGWSSHPHSKSKNRILAFKFQLLVGSELLTVEVSRLHSDTPNLVVLLWTNDWLVAETSTSQHKTLTRDRFFALGGIRTLNPNKQGDADPRFWLCNRWRRVYISVLRFCLHKKRKWANILKLMVASFPFYTLLSSSSSSWCSGRIRFDSCSLYPENEIDPSISFSVVLCVFVLLVYIALNLVNI